MIILYIIGGLIVLLLLIAALMPKKFELRADTIIHAPQKKVWEYVRLFASQKEYSVWVMADPNIQLTYTWVDGTVWATQARDSQDKNVGAGQQEMMAITEDDFTKSFEVEIRFKRPMVATNHARTTLEDVGHGHTKVSNVFRGNNPRPGNLLSSLFLPKVQKDMQQNMNNLRMQIEKKYKAE